MKYKGKYLANVAIDYEVTSHREATRRPVEAETGEWIPKHSQWSKTWECSKCGYCVNLEDGGIYNFCSACGEKMEVPEG